MKRVIFGTALATAALVILQGEVTQAQKGEAAKYGWLTSLEQGKALAKSMGKPLMVVFRCEP